MIGENAELHDVCKSIDALKRAVEESTDILRQLRDNPALLAALLLNGAISAGKALGTEEAILAALDSAQRIIDHTTELRAQRCQGKPPRPKSGVRVGEQD